MRKAFDHESKALQQAALKKVLFLCFPNQTHAWVTNSSFLQATDAVKQYFVEEPNATVYITEVELDGNVKVHRTRPSLILYECVDLNDLILLLATVRSESARRGEEVGQVGIPVQRRQAGW